MRSSPAPIFNKDVIGGFYYKNTANLSTRISAWKKFGTNRQLLFDWLLSLLKLHRSRSDSGISLLDVGCGTGEMLAKFKEHRKNLRTYGVDISPRMIQKASKNENSFGHFVVADISKIPYDEGMFDITTAIFVLHHVPNLSESVSELLRVTKNNGLVLVADGEYDAKTGLNAIFYSALKKLHFPIFMHNKRSYLRTSSRRLARIVDSLGYKRKLHVYRNKMIFRTVSDVMRYFKSGMMYRNSLGPEDKRISSKQWIRLCDEVKHDVLRIINENGTFSIPGNVYCYVIKKNRYV